MGLWDKISDDWLGNNPPPQQAAAPPPPPPFDPTPFRRQVDSAFSMFTPEFYTSQFAKAFEPFKAGLEQQYGTARDQLEAGAASRGLQRSQQGSNLFQQLDALRDQFLGKGKTDAEGFRSNLMGATNTARNSLYGSIGEGGDNAGVGGRAAAEAQRIAATPAPAPALSDLFGAFLKPFTGNRAAGGPATPTQPLAAQGNLNLAGSNGQPEASTEVKKK